MYLVADRFARSAVGDSVEVVAEEGAVAAVVDVDGGSERVGGVVAKHLRARIPVGVDWEPDKHNGRRGRSRVVGRNIV
jgi:hypothetical protein